VLSRLWREAKGNFISGCWFLREDGFSFGGENRRLGGEKKISEIVYVWT